MCLSLAFGIPRAARAPRVAHLLAGALIGAALLVPGAWLAVHGLPARGLSFPLAGYGPWAVAVTMVAITEEVALRAILQPRAREAFGAGWAMVLTAAVFALIHLPLYGPSALPLDFGVGLVFGGLRQRTGSVAACALGHVVADLGSWWVA
jgi:hypothetical protein